MRPPYSLVLIGGPNAEPPVSMADSPLVAEETCLAVGTLADADGLTRIRVGPGHQNPPDRLAFEGSLLLPENRLVVQDVLGQAFLEVDVPGPSVSVQVWTNHLTEPDDILVLFD